jgi:hypothetical protein
VNLAAVHCQCTGACLIDIPSILATEGGGMPRKTAVQCGPRAWTTAERSDIGRGSELDALLAEAGKRGFTWHQFRGDQHGPDVLAGVFQWDDCADVLVLTDECGSHAYRTPTDHATDVFAPTHVLWWYGGNQTRPGNAMVWILRALLTLPRPEVLNALPLVPAPVNTGVPGRRIPVRIRRRLLT